jgi:IS30 family transposase
MTPEEIQERIQELRAENHSLRWIAEELGVSKSTVGNYAKRKAVKAKKPGQKRLSKAVK